MRLPNKLGSVFKVNGRRYPWRAVSPSPERKHIGYFPTKASAIKALYEYKEEPASAKTFSDIYNEWSKEHFDKIKRASPYIVAYRRSAYLYDMKMGEIRLVDLEKAIQESDAPSELQKKMMKQLYHCMFQYAMARDIAQKDYSQYLRFQVEPKRTKTVFSHKEIDILFKDKSSTAKLILIGIFSGWRPSELLEFEIDGDYMLGGNKTAAGKNRIVPIHPLIKKFMNVDRDMSYHAYRARFESKMADYGMNHTPHETRHTFITLAKESGLDDNALKQIVGHSGDFTERTYTHRRKEMLMKEMKKLQY